jgi:hypothetical protein
MKNGYAAMGGSMRRPIYKGVNSEISVGAAIERERRRAAAEARRSSKKK